MNNYKKLTAKMLFLVSIISISMIGVSNAQLPTNYYVAQGDLVNVYDDNGNQIRSQNFDQTPYLDNSNDFLDSVSNVEYDSGDLYVGAGYVDDDSSNEFRIWKVNKTDFSIKDQFSIEENLFTYSVKVRQNYISINFDEFPTKQVIVDKNNFQKTVDLTVASALSIDENEEKAYYYNQSTSNILEINVDDGTQTASSSVSYNFPDNGQGVVSGSNYYYATSDGLAVYNTNDGSVCSSTDNSLGFVESGFSAGVNSIERWDDGKALITSGQSTPIIARDNCTTIDYSEYGSVGDSTPANQEASPRDTVRLDAQKIAVIENDDSKYIHKYNLDNSSEYSKFSISNTFVEEFSIEKVTNGSVSISSTSLEGNTYYSDLDTVNFEASVSNYDEEGTVKFIDEYNGENTTIYEDNAVLGSSTHEYQKTYSGESGQHTFYVVVNTSNTIVKDSGTFTVKRKPEISINYPNTNSEWYLDNAKESNGEYPLFQSEYLEAEITAYEGDVNYEFELTDIANGIPQWAENEIQFTESGTVNAGQTENVTISIPDNINLPNNDGLAWRVEWGNENYIPEFDGIQFNTTLVNKPPEITLFESTPKIESASRGSSFDLEVEGNKFSDQFTDSTINNITYSMDISNAQNPSDTTVSNIGQTSNEFQDYRSDVYEIKKEYCGEDITFNVVVKDAEGRQASDSISGQTAVDLKPEVTALNPNNGEVLEVAPGNVRNPGYEWEIVTYSEPVDVIFYENGQEIEDGVYNENINSTCSNLQESFSSTPDRDAGDYTYQVEVTDESGRTATSDQVSYSIEETENPQDSPNTLTTVQSTPSITEYTEGETPDIYFEGDEGSNNIDYVEITVLVNGQEEKTITVPEEDIQYGSFFSTVTDAFTVAQDWVGENVEIIVDVFNDNQEKDSSERVSGVAGSDVGATVQLNNPNNNDVITYPSGNTETSVNYSFTVNTEEEPVEINLIRNGSVIAQDSLLSTNTERTYEGGIWNENLGSGSYEYWVRLDNYDTDNVEEESSHYSFSVQEDTGEPIISWNVPGNEDTFFYDQGNDFSTVDFTGQVTTPESGVLSVYTGGEQVESTNINSGQNQQFGLVQELTKGNYSSYLRFESENYNISTNTREFGVIENPPSEPSVYLDNPSDGSFINLGTDYFFRYYMSSNQTGTVSMEIREEDTGNVFYSSPSGNEYDYDKLNNYAYYSEEVSLDQEGSFVWDATFNGDEGDTVTSVTDTFTVQDLGIPSFNLTSPDDGDLFTVPVGGERSVRHNFSVDLTDFSSTDNIDLKFEVVEVTSDGGTVSVGGGAIEETVEGGQELSKSYVFNDLDDGKYRWDVSATTPENREFSSESREYNITELETTGVVTSLKPDNESYKIPVGDSLDVDHSFSVDSSSYPSYVSFVDNLTLYRNGQLDTSVAGESKSAGEVYNISRNVAGLIPESQQDLTDGFNTSAEAVFEWVVTAEFDNGDVYSKEGSYNLSYLNPLNLTSFNYNKTNYLEDRSSINVPVSFNVDATGLSTEEEYKVNLTSYRNDVLVQSGTVETSQGGEVSNYSKDIVASEPGEYNATLNVYHSESNSSRTRTFDFTVYGDYQFTDSKPENDTVVNARVPTTEKLSTDLFSRNKDGVLTLFFEGERVVQEYVDTGSDENTTAEVIGSDTYRVSYDATELEEGNYSWSVSFDPESSDQPVLTEDYRFSVEEGFIERFVGWVSDQVNRFENSLGDSGLFALATFLTLAFTVLVIYYTDKAEIGLVSMVLLTMTFVFVEWFPAWIGMIIFFISVGVGVWMISRVSS